MSLKNVGMWLVIALIGLWLAGLFGCSQGPPLKPEEREARVAEAAKMSKILADQGVRAVIFVELPTEMGLRHETSFGSDGRIIFIGWNDPADGP